MKRYSVDAIRNVVLAGHGHTGKTTLAEAMLYDSGAIDRIGRVDAGTATTDFDPDEHRRTMSINVSLAPCEWRERKINVIDTPGYADFAGEVASGMRVADAAILVVAAPAGVEVGTETAWDLAQERDLPRLIFINKMDRENADFERCMESIKNAFGSRCVPVQLPIGQEAGFRGVVDIIHQVAYIGSGKDVKQEPIPADVASQIDLCRQGLMEAAAESDDDLLEKYLGGEMLTDDEIIRGLVTCVKAGSTVPVFVGSATANIGIQPLMDALIELAPSPVEAGAVAGTKVGGSEVTLEPGESAPLSALVFKTLSDPYVGKLTYFRVYSGVLHGGHDIHNATKQHDERIGQLYVMRGKHQTPVQQIAAGDIGAVAKLSVTATGDTLCDKTNPVTVTPIAFPHPSYSVAIVAASKADEDKMGPALGRLAEEDPTFRFHRDPGTGQTVISGAGEAHLDIIVERLKRFGASVTTRDVKIAYQETITGTAKVQGRHKKQTGGRGQFGDCWVEFAARERGAGYEFVDAIVGGSIPRQYIPAVDKGIQEAMEHGVLGGFKVVDFRATCYDGSFHPVDSSEQAFKTAGALAFRAGMEKAHAVLLEPLYTMEIIVPDQYMGDVISDMNTKRGRVLGMEPIGNGKQLVRAEAPQAEIQRYAIDLRSIARGRGTFRAEFSHYEEVPQHITAAVVEKAKKEREE